MVFCDTLLSAMYCFYRLRGQAKSICLAQAGQSSLVPIQFSSMAW